MARAVVDYTLQKVFIVVVVTYFLATIVMACYGKHLAKSERYYKQLLQRHIE